MEKIWLEKVIWKENQKKLKAGASMVHSKDSGRSRCLACPSISSGRTNFKNKRLKASVHTGYFMRCACHQALVATWKQEQRLVVSSMRYEFLRASKENFWKPRQDQLSGFSEHPCRANRSAAIAECVTRSFEGLVTLICRANRSCAIVRTGLPLLNPDHLDRHAQFVSRAALSKQRASQSKQLQWHFASPSVSFLLPPSLLGFVFPTLLRRSFTNLTQSSRKFAICMKHKYIQFSASKNSSTGRTVARGSVFFKRRLPKLQNSFPSKLEMESWAPLFLKNTQINCIFFTSK